MLATRTSGTALLFCMLPFVVYAANEPGDCATIDGKDDRLACYDSFFVSNSEQRRTVADTRSLNDLTPIQARVNQEEAVRDNWFSITPHRPNYILPATYNASADFTQYGLGQNFFSDAETKFQLSLKTTLFTDLWRNSSIAVAYTQQSYWQLFADEEASAPFRETNHEPEVMWQIPVDFDLFGFRARQLAFAFVHQSNGRERPLSRSWNRVTSELVFERNRFVLSAKTWARVDDPDLDDNPNIEDYMGRIQLGAAYKGDRHTFALGIKNSLDSDLRSGVEFNWLFPLSRRLKGFVQLYSGYGENLIDMENYHNRVGVGIALTDWL